LRSKTKVADFVEVDEIIVKDIVFAFNNAKVINKLKQRGLAL
jgi:hypothetical protein